jgi:hypothetical protein
VESFKAGDRRRKADLAEWCEPTSVQRHPRARGGSKQSSGGKTSRRKIAMKKIIYVNYISRFANNIFQYALAHIIRELVDGEIFFSPTCVIRMGESHDRPAEEIPIEEMPLYQITDSRNTLSRREWSGKFRPDEKVALRKTGVCFAEDLLEFEGERLVISDAYCGESIILAGYYQDYRYYRGRRDFVSRLLKTPPPTRVPDPDDIVLNFRGTDLSWAQMPPTYYCWILDKERFEKLWIVTEDPGHETVTGLLKRYPGEVRSHGAIADFQFVRAARKILMSVSTFCWMAAWLSEADRIYFPLGSPYPLFEKAEDRRLIVFDDQRYVYVKPRFSRTFTRKIFPLYRLTVAPDGGGV